jgi:nitrous oxidase accessory protein NosD
MPQLRQTSLRLALALAFALLSSAAARAIPQTFVARLGNNANACTESSPCSTLGGALAKTDAGGEIVVLDSGEFGAVSISKAVRISADGVYAGVTATVGPAITVNAASTDVVVLRGLTLNGKGGNYGVDFMAGAALHIENCHIAGFSSRGIFFHAPGQLLVKDTYLRGNTNTGIYISLSSGAATASLEHCQLEKNSYGVYVSAASPGTAKVVVRNTTAVGNGVTGAGYYATGTGVQLTVENSAASYGSTGFYAIDSAKLNMKNCTSVNNSYGVATASSGTKVCLESCGLFNNSSYGLYAPDGTVLISDSVLTGNGTGIYKAGAATIKSNGKNRLDGNTTNYALSGSITPISQI